MKIRARVTIDDAIIAGQIYDAEERCGLYVIAGAERNPWGKAHFEPVTAAEAAQECPCGVRRSTCDYHRS